MSGRKGYKPKQYLLNSANTLGDTISGPSGDYEWTHKWAGFPGRLSNDLPHVLIWRFRRATLISWFPPAQLSENTLSTSEKFIFVLIFSWLQRLDAHTLCSQVNKFLSGSWELSNEWLVAFHKVTRMESQGGPPDGERVLDNANTFLGFQVSAGIHSGHGACWAKMPTRLLGGHIWPYELLSIRSTWAGSRGALRPFWYLLCMLWEWTQSLYIDHTVYTFSLTINMQPWKALQLLLMHLSCFSRKQAFFPFGKLQPIRGIPFIMHLTSEM